MKRSKGYQGFSLIELVVALGIVAITSGVLMTHWVAPNRERHQLMQNAQLLASSFRYAQQMTMQGVRTQVRLGGDRIVIETLQPEIFEGIETDRYRMQYHRSHVFTDGVVIHHTNVNERLLRFSNRGTPSHGGSTTRLRSQHYELAVTVTVSGGRTRISDLTTLNRP